MSSNQNPAYPCKHPTTTNGKCSDCSKTIFLFGADPQPPAPNVGSPGHALAMRVLQSDLYAKLDDLERVECDALIKGGNGEVTPKPRECWVCYAMDGQIVGVTANFNNTPGHWGRWVHMCEFPSGEQREPTKDPSQLHQNQQVAAPKDQGEG